MNKINIATIGTSNICEQFIKGMSINNRFNLKAVYSRNFERGLAFAKKFNCETVYTDLNSLANDKNIDACYIASVNSSPFEQSKLLLKASKHVICEKPIVTDLSQYDQLKSIADKNQLIYMEAITSFYSKGRKKLLDLLDEIGNLSMIRLDFSQRSSKLDRYLKGEHINVFDPNLNGGVLNDLGVYCIYACLELFGLPKSISANASYLASGADKSGSITFDYQETIAVLTYSKTGQSYCNSEIIGENGTIKIGSISQLTDLTLIKDNKEISFMQNTPKEELMSCESESFADFIQNFNQNKIKYQEASNLCKNVHSVMQQVRKLI